MNASMIDQMIVDLMANNNLRCSEDYNIGGWVVNWTDDRGRERTTIFTLVPNPEPEFVSISYADRSPVFGTWGGGSFSLSDVRHAIVRFVVSER